MNKLLACLLVGGILVAVSGCKPKEEAPMKDASAVKEMSKDMPATPEAPKDHPAH